MLVQSLLALLVPPSGYLVVFATARLSCFAWCVVTVWLRSSLLFMATKASALCGAPPSTPCCGCCFGALPSCTEDSSWVIQLPYQDAARAACATLAGPCCFLPPVPAAFPGALSLFPAGLHLLPSPCPFRLLASFAVLAAVVFFGLLFGAPLRRPFVVCVGVDSGLFFGLFWPSLFVVFLLVVWWAVLAACSLR